MARHIVCPNCGGGHELVNPGIVTLVCEHCHTHIYLSDEAVDHLGQQSLLAEDDSRLHLGATGTVAGRGFTAVGHVRFRHPDGFWDEWYLQLSDGRAAWLMEAGRRLSLETLARLEDAPSPARLLTNQPATKDAGITYLTRQTGQATCEGSAGQLPFAVDAGEEITWADLATLDGKRVGTIEQVGHQPPWLYTGVPVPHERLEVDIPADETASKSREALDVDCPHCGAPLAQPAGEVETLVCEYCGAQADLSGGRATVMGVNPKGRAPEFTLAIGQAGRLECERWEVCGRVLRTIGEGRDERQVREYALYHPAREARWLFEEDGHFVLSAPAAKAPVLDPLVVTAPKKPVPVGSDDVYRFARAGGDRVEWVDGALPHRAAVGDRHAWAELVDPPRHFLVKASGPEMHCYAGRYLPAENVWQAFGLGSPVPKPRGVHASQPFRPGPLFRGLLWTGLAFAAINLMLLAMAWFNEGDEVVHRLVDPVDYKMDDVVLPAVRFDGPGVLGVKLGAPLGDDDQLSVVFGLADERDRVVVQDKILLQDPRHAGVLGSVLGDHPDKVTRLLRIPEAGSYRPLVRAGGGREVEPLTVTLTTGLWNPTPILWVLGMALLLPLGAWLVYRAFDGQRWQGSLRGGLHALDDRLASVFEESRGADGGRPRREGIGRGPDTDLGGPR